MKLINVTIITFLIFLVNTTSFAYTIPHDTVINEVYNKTEKIYDFVVKSGQGFTAVLNAHFTEGRVYLYFLNENGESLKNDGWISNGQTGIVEKKFEADGTYYIKVTGEAVGSYDLALYNAWFNPGVNDSNRDFYSSIFTSKLVPVTDTPFNVKHQGGATWFRFNVQAGQGFTAVLNVHFNEGRVYLYFLNENGETLINDGWISNGQTGIVEKKFEANGTYYIYVTGDAVGDYDLALYNAWFNSGIDDSNRDFYSTPFTARNMINGSHQTNFYANDWYKLSVQAGNTINVSITPHLSEGKLYLYLRNSDGVTLISRGWIYNDQTQVITKQLMETDIYYVNIQGSAAGNYSINVEGYDVVENITESIITGFVTDSQGNGVSNVAIQLSGSASKTTFTDEDGWYYFDQLSNGYYTISAPNTKSYFPYYESNGQVYCDRKIELVSNHTHVSHVNFTTDQTKPFVKLIFPRSGDKLKGDFGLFGSVFKQKDCSTCKNIDGLLILVNDEVKFYATLFAGSSGQFSLSQIIWRDLNNQPVNITWEMLISSDEPVSLQVAAINQDDIEGLSEKVIVEKGSKQAGKIRITTNNFKLPVPATTLSRRFDFQLQETVSALKPVWFSMNMEYPEKFPDRGEYDQRESTSNTITKKFSVADVYPLGLVILDNNGNTLVDIEQVMVYHAAKYGNPESNLSGSMLAGFGVNVVSGNFYYQANDLILEGINIPFVFGRHYNSIGYKNWSVFGHGGWTHSYDYRIFFSESGRRLYLATPDGHNERFAYVNGNWQTMVPGSYWVIKENIIHNEGNPLVTYSAWNKSNTRYDFTYTDNGFWSISKITDHNNNQLIFSYNGDRIIQIKDTRGRNITLDYDAGNKLKSINDGTGRKIVFVYNNENYLWKCIDAENNVYEYEYNYFNNRKMLHKIIDPIGNVVLSNSYDNDGKVTNQTDALDNIWLFSYLSEQTIVTNPLLHEIKYIIDPYTQMIVQVEDPLSNKNVLTYKDNISPDGIQEVSLVKTAISPKHYGHSKLTAYEYSPNKSGNPTKVTDPANMITTFSWEEDRSNQNKNLIDTVQPPGITGKFAFNYDSKGNIKQLNNPLQQSLQFTYTNKGQILSSIDELNRKTIYTYENDYLKKIIDPKGNFTEYFYDNKGRVSSIRDKRGFITNYRYNNNDKITEIEDPYGNTIGYEYDKSGNLISIKDKLGNYTHYTYNKANLMKSITQTIKEETYITLAYYDGLQRLWKVQNPRDYSMLKTFDASGNVKKNINALEQYIEKNYDANGNVIQVSYKDEKGNLIKTELKQYDDADRILQTDIQMNQKKLTTKYTYNEKGLVESITDPNNNITLYNYDNLGRIISITEPGSSSKTFAEYDAVGNLIKIINSEEHITRFEYDELNQLRFKKDHENNIWEYNYDENGNMTYYKDPKGQIIRYVYDKLNQLIETIYSDSEKTQFFYDENGNLKTMEDLEGKTENEYDELNRLISRTDSYGQTVNYTYNKVGKVKSITYPNGKKVLYDFDPINRMTKVTDWLNQSTSYTYNVLGQIISIVNGNDTKVIMEYDSAGRLINHKNLKSTNEIISESKLTLDNNGNYISTRATMPMAPILKLKTELFSNNSLNQIISKDLTQYKYDRNGNLIQEKNNHTTKTFGYDFDDYLVSWTDNTNYYQYTYSGDKNRIASTNNNQTIRYVLNDNNVLPEVICRTDTLGNIIDTFIYGENGLVSQITSDQSIYYYHFDSSGNTIAQTNKNQDIINKYAYTPYGQVRKSERVKNPFQYSGKYGVMAEDNGLYYMRARYYYPEVRRFINLDRTWGEIDEPQSLNLYTYVQGNPIMRVDPSGNIFWDAVDVGFFMMSAINFIKKPSLVTGVEMLLDTAGLLPVVPSLGYITKAGEAIQIGKKIVDVSVDFTKFLKRGDDQINMAVKIKKLTLKKFSRNMESIKTKSFRNKYLATKYRNNAKKKIEKLTKKDKRYQWVKKYYDKADAEHPHELQLGGADNGFFLLHRSINRSSGAQIKNQLKKYRYGTIVNIKTK